MLSSAPREVPPSELEQVAASPRSMKSRWVRALSGLFTWRPSGPGAAEAGTNALLAFPSESADLLVESAAGPEAVAAVFLKKPRSVVPSLLIRLRPALLAAGVVAALAVALVGGR